MSGILFSELQYYVAVTIPLLAEVMDKMPSLSFEWTRAVIGGVATFILSRYLRFGWLIALAVTSLFFIPSMDWFRGSVAKSALSEDPVTTRLAQSALLLPLACLCLGLWLRRRCESRDS